MRSISRALAAAGLLASLALAAVAVAAPKEPKEGDKKAAPKKKDDKAKAKAEEPKPEPKDDKAGVAKAISPYDQLILDADKAFAAGLAGGALDEPIALYRKAIANDPARPEAHLFLGGALYQKGEYDAAEESLVAATSRARADKAYLNLLGKSLFLTATVKEARAKGDEAKLAWQAYETFAKENPDQDNALKEKLPEGSPTPPVAVKVFLGSAVERITKIEGWEKRVQDYAKVKELVLKRQRELGIPAEPTKPADKK
jgi:tetratricopeptide (TPR) repeat protein